MGLDAVVYRNKKHLELGDDEGISQFIPETGEVYFENDEISRKYRDQFEAVSFRLGNITAIAELRSEMANLAGENNLLYVRFLYSGSHSGDHVPLEELPKILNEISALRQIGTRSQEFTFFLDQVEELVRVAGIEGNPIVFV